MGDEFKHDQTGAPELKFVRPCCYTAGTFLLKDGGRSRLTSDVHTRIICRVLLVNSCSVEILQC